MATMKDIARETGLGLATISKYVNGGKVREKNKEAIEAAIQKLGFTVNEMARGLKTNRSQTIGVIIPELNNIFITTIITVVGDILRQHGYGVLVCDCRSDEQQESDAVRFLLSKQVDGIINMPFSKDGDHLMSALEKDIPVVLVDRKLPGLEDRASFVLVDNVGASARATETFLDAGHTDIGIILGPKDVFTSQQRLLGYSNALLQRGLLPAESRTIYSDYSLRGGFESMKRLLNEGCRAVFVTNYEMTLGAVIAVNELGLQIPRDLSLIGFDNQQLSRVIRPRLTIVTQPLTEIGEAVADILLARLTGDGEPKTQCVTLTTGMIEGESVEDRRAK